MNVYLSILSSGCTIWQIKKRGVEETSTHTRIHCFLTLCHMHLTKGKVGKNTAWTANCFEGLTRKKEIRYREEDPLPIYSRSMTLPSIKTYKTCCFLFSMFLLSSLQQSKHVKLAVALGLWIKGFFPSKICLSFTVPRQPSCPDGNMPTRANGEPSSGGSILDGISSKAGAVGVGNNSPQVVLLMHR